MFDEQRAKAGMVALLEPWLVGVVVLFGTTGRPVSFDWEVSLAELAIAQQLSDPATVRAE